MDKPQTLGTIAAVIVITLLALWNQRWIIGAFHYRTEYSLALEGTRNLSVICRHTLNEQNIWNRVQANDEWYFVQTCGGNREGVNFVRNGTAGQSKKSESSTAEPVHNKIISTEPTLVDPAPIPLPSDSTTTTSKPSDSTSTPSPSNSTFTEPASTKSNPNDSLKSNPIPLDPSRPLSPPFWIAWLTAVSAFFTILWSYIVYVYSLCLFCISIGTHHNIVLIREGFGKFIDIVNAIWSAIEAYFRAVSEYQHFITIISWMKTAYSYIINSYTDFTTAADQKTPAIVGIVKRLLKHQIRGWISRRFSNSLMKRVWEGVLISASTILQATGRMSTYRYSIVAGPWFPQWILGLAFLLHIDHWLSFIKTYFLSPVIPYLGITIPTLLLILFILGAYLYFASHLIDRGYYGGEHVNNGSFWRTLPNFLYFGRIPYQDVEWQWNQLFREAAVYLVRTFWRDSPIVLLCKTIVSFFSGEDQWRRELAFSMGCIFVSVGAWLRQWVSVMWAGVFLVISALLLANSCYIVGKLSIVCFKFARTNVSRFIYYTWPNVIFDLPPRAKQNIYASRAQAFFSLVGGAYIVVTTTQALSNFAASLSFPFTISVAGFSVYIGIRRLFYGQCFIYPVLAPELQSFGTFVLLNIFSSIVLLVIARLSWIPSINCFYCPIENGVLSALVYLCMTFFVHRALSVLPTIGATAVWKLYHVTGSRWLASLLWLGTDFDDALEAPVPWQGWSSRIVSLLLWIALVKKIFFWDASSELVTRMFATWFAFFAVKGVESANPRPAEASPVLDLWTARFIRILALSALVTDDKFISLLFPLVDNIMGSPKAFSYSIGIALSISIVYFTWNDAFLRICALASFLCGGILLQHESSGFSPIPAIIASLVFTIISARFFYLDAFLLLSISYHRAINAVHGIFTTPAAQQNDSAGPGI